MDNLKDLYKLKVYKGDVGIEIEIEGGNLPDPPKGWSIANDGSLRGPSAEYITSGPLKFSNVESRIKTLISSIKNNGGNINDSVRAGVHVHISVQDLTPLQLINFITLYYVIENPLIRWCGSNREGNLFCLRVKDAEYVMDVLMAAIRSYSFRACSTDEIRYSSLNLKPITSYGSVEFRSMQTPVDLENICTWIDLLKELFESSKKFETPEHIIQEFSMDTSDDFMKRVWPNLHPLLMYKDVDKDLKDGMRNAQDIAYASDWSNFNEKVKKVSEKIIKRKSINWVDEVPRTLNIRTEGGRARLVRNTNGLTLGRLIYEDGVAMSTVEHENNMIVDEDLRRDPK